MKRIGEIIATMNCRTESGTDGKKKSEQGEAAFRIAELLIEACQRRRRKDAASHQKKSAEQIIL